MSATMAIATESAIDVVISSISGSITETHAASGSVSVSGSDMDVYLIDWGTAIPDEG